MPVSLSCHFRTPKKRHTASVGVFQPREVPMHRLAPLIAVALAGCSAVRYREAWSPDAAVERVEIEVERGDVRVRTGPLRVQREIRAARGTLDLSHAIVDGTLVLRARCTTPLPCAVDTLLEVPDGLPVTLSVGAGAVDVRGGGAIHLELAEGVAELAGAGPWTVNVGQGSISLWPEGGSTVRAAVAAGDIRAVVPPGSVSVEATAATVFVAPDASAKGGAGLLSLVAPVGAVHVGVAGSVARR
jgi:hypothetical protein